MGVLCGQVVPEESDKVPWKGKQIVFSGCDIWENSTMGFLIFHAGSLLHHPKPLCDALRLQTALSC